MKKLIPLGLMLCLFSTVTALAASAPPNVDDVSSANGWWSPHVDPWVGGIGGPLIGCMGGVLGWLAGKGKAREFVLAAWKACIAFGILCLVAMAIALAVKQPWYVGETLMIFGIVSTCVFGATFPAARKLYADQETRRMAALDTAGG